MMRTEEGAPRGNGSSNLSVQPKTNSGYGDYGTGLNTRINTEKEKSIVNEDFPTTSKHHALNLPPFMKFKDINEFSKFVRNPCSFLVRRGAIEEPSKVNSGLTENVKQVQKILSIQRPEPESELIQSPRSGMLSTIRDKAKGLVRWQFFQHHLPDKVSETDAGNTPKPAYGQLYRFPPKVFIPGYNPNLQMNTYTSWSRFINTIFGSHRSESKPCETVKTQENSYFKSVGRIAKDLYRWQFMQHHIREEEQRPSNQENLERKLLPRGYSSHLAHSLYGKTIKELSNEKLDKTKSAAALNYVSMFNRFLYCPPYMPPLIKPIPNTPSYSEETEKKKVLAICGEQGL